MIEQTGKNKNITGVAFLVMLFFVFISSGSLAYIMPAEQLLEFMIKNFSKLDTLVIIQATQQETTLEDEKIQKQYKEQLWLKSPGHFQSRVLEQEGDRPVVRDLSYRRLIMAGDRPEIEDFLRGIGIDLEQVTLTRIDGTIAFRIGAPGPQSAHLLIEKERFLPLLISYPSPEISGKRVVVRFRDYRQLEQGWYPFEIVYAVGDEMKETYTIQSYEADVPINLSILSEEKENRIPPGAEKGDKTEQDNERLKKIIKSFEEKYH